MNTIFKALIVISLLIPLSAFSQSEISEDWTGADSNGIERSLYEDYLDQGMTVLIEFFQTTCAPCVSLAPQYEILYQDWGAGEEQVEFISLSNIDDNEAINEFREDNGLTYPAIGVEGGGLDIHNMYTSGEYGEFIGWPTFAIIAPDYTIRWDPREDDLEWVFLLDHLLAEIVTLGTALDLEENHFENFSIGPVPVSNYLNIFGLNGLVDLKVLNSVGQIIVQKRNTNISQLDVSNLDAGVYFLQVSMDGSSKTFRIPVTR